MKGKFRDPNKRERFLFSVVVVGPPHRIPGTGQVLCVGLHHRLSLELTEPSKQPVCWQGHITVTRKKPDKGTGKCCFSQGSGHRPGVLSAVTHDAPGARAWHHSEPRMLFLPPSKRDS